jgi:hypothetical protein
MRASIHETMHRARLALPARNRCPTAVYVCLFGHYSIILDFAVCFHDEQSLYPTTRQARPETRKEHLLAEGTLSCRLQAPQAM